MYVKMLLICDIYKQNVYKKKRKKEERNMLYFES